MTTRMLAAWTLGVCVAVSAMQMPADETHGRVISTGFGRFTLDENGSTREFNLFSGKSQYDPTTWRPSDQDSVKVVFTTNKVQKRTILAVERVTLVEAGPNTVAAVDSPVVAEITEVSSSGVKARLPSGHIAKFSYQRGTQYVPTGWIPAVGDQARIESHAQPTMVFTVSFVIDKVERAGGTPVIPVRQTREKTR